MARLLIHATDERRLSATDFSEKVRRLLPWRSHGRLPGARAGLHLNITDARGFQVFALDDAGPLVDVPLPAGTYHVIARMGSVRRSYTMALDQGASVNLYLAFAPDR